MLELHTLLLIGLAVAIASFIHGFSGFGFGIISMALFSMLPFDLERISAVLSIVALLIISTLVFFSGKDSKIVWKHVLFISLGILIGSPLGYGFLLAFKDQPLFRVIAGMIFMYFAVHNLFSLHARRELHTFFGVLLGIASGFISGALVSGGPPIIFYLYSRVKDPRKMKGTVQVVFVVLCVIRIFLVVVKGPGYTMELGKVILYVTPAGLLLLILGHFLSRFSSVSTFKKIVYVLLFLFGLLVCVKGIGGLL